MKKRIYESMKLTVVSASEEDILRTSKDPWKSEPDEWDAEVISKL